MFRHHNVGNTTRLHPGGHHQRSGTGSAHPAAGLTRLLPGGIRARLFLLIALALLPALLLQAWIYYQHYATRRSQALETELEVAQGVATTFSAYVDGVRQHLETVGKALIAFPSPTDPRAELVLRTASTRYTTIRSVSWTGPDGIILASSLPGNAGRGLFLHPDFMQTLTDRSWAISDLAEREITAREPTVVIGTAIRDNGGVLRGMVVASIAPTRLGKLTLTQERPADGTYTIFDRRGVVVYCHSDESLTWGQRRRWQESDPALRRVMETGRAHVGVTSRGVPGSKWILARTPISDFGWVAGAARPADVAFAPVWHGLLQDAGLGLAIVSLAFLLAFLLARTIAEPLQRLQRDAQAMGQGRIETSDDAEAPDEVRSLRDTVAAIAGALIEQADALRHSERLYRKLFEANLAGVYITKPDGTILDFNEAMMKMLGYDSREEIFEHSSTDFYADPEFRDELIRLLRKDGVVPGREALLKRKDGSILNALGSAVLLTDEQTGEPYIQGVAIDITERKRTEEALQRSEQRFRKLFEADLMGVFITKPDGTILNCNNTMAKILGYDSREEVLQHRSTDFYVDPKFRAEAIRVLQRDGIYPGREGLLRRKDGTIIHTLGFAVLLADEQTGEPYIQGVAVDITERKRMEESLRDLTATLENKVAERTAELEHRARQLQRLTLELSQAEDRERKRVAEILHDDLQQVLAGAKFHLGLLAVGNRGIEESREIVRQIRQMIQDAIEKSRNLSHELSPAILHQSDLEGTLNWLARQMQSKYGLTVHMDIRGPLGSQPEPLRAFLYKAAQELLFNVVKHARVNEARVRVRRLGPYLCLSVSDRGRGFDPQRLSEIAKFGLFSIRERVELLGGRMKVRSVKGRGSTFYLVVPRAHETEDRRQMAEGGALRGSSAVVRPPSSGPVLRVLLADDHEIVRQGIASLLSEEPGIEVVAHAANGREAVDLAYRYRPDVVVMDASMPLMSGDEATRQIKKYLPQTRVVALSMYEEEEMVERMYRAGAEAYVLKTAPSEDLIAAICGKVPVA